MPAPLPTIFCAIDTPDLDRACALAWQISPVTGSLKLGLEFFMAQGPQGVRLVQDASNNAPLFLDIKLHDIPNTVAAAIRSVVPLSPMFITIHTGGGAEMMRAAQHAAQDEALRLGLVPPKLLGVTVLTSLDDQALAGVGQQTPTADQVLRLAGLARESGLAGIICSGHDIQPVRRKLGNDFILMVPGIRPAGSAVGDQKRVMTPQDAMKAGATHLVIGRPITGDADPARAAMAIVDGLRT